MGRFTKIITVAIISAWSAVAVAQDGLGDWDLTESPERGMIAASTTFSSGITIAVRCLNGQYDALIGGLPAVDPGTESRTLSLQFGEDEQDETSWYVGTNPRFAAMC